MKEETAQEEALLITRVLAGDGRAFEELFHAERARLHNVAFGILRNQWDAEEVVQDAFACAYRKLHEFRRECTLSTWLHTIVANFARNKYWYFRRRFRHASVILDERIAGTAEDPATSTSNREIVENLASWLEELPITYREVVTARVFRDHSYEEIAAKLAINVGTVKSRLSRARGHLRRRLSDPPKVASPAFVA